MSDIYSSEIVKVSKINPEVKFIFFHRFILWQVLCKSVLKINHNVDFAVCIVNYTRARAVNQTVCCTFHLVLSTSVSITAGFYYLKEEIILTHEDTCSEDVGSLSQ